VENVLTFTPETRRRCLDRFGVDPDDAYLGLMHEILVGGRPYQQLLARVQQMEPLTKPSVRQIETMRYVAQGFTNDEIAALMFVAPETVKSAVREVLRKIGARNRTHAAVLCLLLGLFEEEA
jgi:DNA-binding NarL/FixJ family response regulator